MGDLDELEIRHDCEDALDLALRQEGIGSVDGGQTGANSMEIYCDVSDVAKAHKIAKAVLDEMGFIAPTIGWNRSNGFEIRMSDNGWKTLEGGVWKTW